MALMPILCWMWSDSRFVSSIHCRIARLRAIVSARRRGDHDPQPVRRKDHAHTTTLFTGLNVLDYSGHDFSVNCDQIVRCGPDETG